MSNYLDGYIGSNAIVWYGDVALFATSWSLDEMGDKIDVTTINIYDQPRELKRKNFFDKINAPEVEEPFDLKGGRAEGTAEWWEIQREYGGSKQFIYGGLKQCEVQVEGYCADLEENRVTMPRIGNIVNMVFDANTADTKDVSMNVYWVLITNVKFSNSVQGYFKWQMQGIATNEFDTFPGKGGFP